MLEPPLASTALVLPSAIPVPTASPDLGLGSQACAEGGYLESKDTENEKSGERGERGAPESIPVIATAEGEHAGQEACKETEMNPNKPTLG